MRMFWLFGKKAQYETFNWWENFMSGNITIGNITIYGSNAMCWCVNIKTDKWGYICFTLPSIKRKKSKMGHHFYLSPNATPWACTFYKGNNECEKIRASIRKMNFGHNFNVNNKDVYDRLRCLNNKFELFRITGYDLISSAA